MRNLCGLCYIKNFKCVYGLNIFKIMVGHNSRCPKYQKLLKQYNKKMEKKQK